MWFIIFIISIILIKYIFIAFLIFFILIILSYIKNLTRDNQAKDKRSWEDFKKKDDK